MIQKLKSLLKNLHSIQFKGIEYEFDTKYFKILSLKSILGVIVTKLKFR